MDDAAASATEAGEVTPADDCCTNSSGYEREGVEWIAFLFFL